MALQIGSTYRGYVARLSNIGGYGYVQAEGNWPAASLSAGGADFWLRVGQLEFVNNGGLVVGDEVVFTVATAACATNVSKA